MKPEITLPPRIRARVGQADPNQGFDGKWFFEVSIATFYGENIGDPLGPFGPFETEALARQEMMKAVKLCAEAYELKVAGEKSGQYMDMLNGGALRKWEMH